MVTYLSLLGNITGENPVVTKQFSLSGLSEQKDQSYFVKSIRSHKIFSKSATIGMKLSNWCIRSLVQFQWTSSFEDLSAIKDLTIFSNYGETNLKTKRCETSYV